MDINKLTNTKSCLIWAKEVLELALQQSQSKEEIKEIKDFLLFFMQETIKKEILIESRNAID